MKLYLVLEDDPVTRRLACGAADKAGFFSVGVATLAGAREALGVWPVDGVLVDLALPDGTGMDFVRELRHDRGATGPPVIICTADAERDTVAEAVRAGANDYAVKPFDLRELSYRLRRLMDRVPPRWDPWVQIGVRTELTPVQHSAALTELQAETRAFAARVGDDADPHALQELWARAGHLGHRSLATLLGDVVEGVVEADARLAARLRREARAIELFHRERTRGVGRLEWRPESAAGSVA